MVKPELTESVPRARDREKTLDELKLALHRLQKQGALISIKGVAEEAKVSPALLHNRYPDFTEQVRALTGKSTRAQRDEKHSLLQEVRETNRQLRKQIDSQTKEIAKLASINEALRAELTLQKAIAEGKVSKGQFGGQKGG